MCPLSMYPLIGSDAVRKKCFCWNSRKALNYRHCRHPTITTAIVDRDTAMARDIFTQNKHPSETPAAANKIYSQAIHFLLTLCNQIYTLAHKDSHSHKGSEKREKSAVLLCLQQICTLINANTHTQTAKNMRIDESNEEIFDSIAIHTQKICQRNE